MSKIELRAFEKGDVDWLVDAHARLYAQDEGFDDTFGPLVRAILTDYFANRDPDLEKGWLAHSAGQRLGSIFCVKGAPDRAKLRLFLVDPGARGMGLGKLLLKTCMDHAATHGFTGMDLWTHESHRAACALYAKTGWRLVRSEPVYSFGQDLVEQSWSIDFPLAPAQSRA